MAEPRRTAAGYAGPVAASTFQWGQTGLNPARKALRKERAWYPGETASHLWPADSRRRAVRTRRGSAGIPGIPCQGPRGPDGLAGACATQNPGLGFRTDHEPRRRCPLGPAVSAERATRRRPRRRGGRAAAAGRPTNQPYGPSADVPARAVTKMREQRMNARSSLRLVPEDFDLAALELRRVVNGHRVEGVAGFLVRHPVSKGEIVPDVQNGQHHDRRGQEARREDNDAFHSRFN